MTWTYTGNPTASPLDAVRLLIGDTVEAEPLLSDEEVLYFLTQAGSVEGAAIRACEALASRFAREADIRVGELSVSLAQRAVAFERRAALIRQLIATGWLVFPEAKIREPLFSIDQFTLNGERSVKEKK